VGFVNPQFTFVFPAQIDSFNPSEISLSEIGLSEIGATEIGVNKIYPTEIGASKIGTTLHAFQRKLG
jgi:hypothetical protein